jgi:tetratricopeptide (TPR) repeat protein
MRRETAERTRMAGVLATLLLAATASAQYREYYVRGRVVDGAGRPIAEVQIDISDASTSRAFHMKTEKDGVFKFAGLPHGLYAVKFSKERYSTKQAEWDFKASQDSMKRVDIPDVVLASEEQVQRTERIQAGGARTKEAAEKIRNQDFDGALSLLEGVLRQSPDDSDALFLQGVSYAGKKMWREAVAPLTRVTELSPQFPGAYFQLGVCHGKLGDSPKALEFYDKNLALEPGNANSAYNSGLILFESNRIDEALARFEAGLSAKPDDPDLHEMAGRCYVHQAKFREAVEHLERARAGTTDPAKQAFLDGLIRETKPLIR